MGCSQSFFVVSDSTGQYVVSHCKEWLIGKYRHSVNLYRDIRRNFSASYRQPEGGHDGVQAIELLNSVIGIASANGDDRLAEDTKRLCDLLRDDPDNETEVRRLLEIVARDYVLLQKQAVSEALSRELVKAVDTFLERNVLKKLVIAMETPATWQTKLPRIIGGYILTDSSNSRLYDPADAEDELAVADVLFTSDGQDWLLRGLPHELAELASAVTTCGCYKLLKKTLNKEQLYSRKNQSEANKRKTIRTLLQLQNTIKNVWTDADKKPFDVPLFFVPLCTVSLTAEKQRKAITEAEHVMNAVVEAYRPPASQSVSASTEDLINEAAIAEGCKMFQQEATKFRSKRNQESAVGQFRNCSAGDLFSWLDDSGLRFLAIAEACLHDDDNSGLLFQLLPEPASVPLQRKKSKVVEPKLEIEIELNAAKLTRDWIVLSEDERVQRLLNYWMSRLQALRAAQPAPEKAQLAEEGEAEAEGGAQEPTEEAVQQQAQEGVPHAVEEIYGQ